MALAGFSKKDIEIKSADSQLTIKSVESDDKEEKETLHRGISKRKFSRTILEENHKNGSGGLRLVINSYFFEKI